MKKFLPLFLLCFVPLCGITIGFPSLVVGSWLPMTAIIIIAACDFFGSLIASGVFCLIAGSHCFYEEEVSNG